MEEEEINCDSQILEVEHGCYSLLIFSTSGGLAPICDTVFKHIALLTSEN